MSSRRATPADGERWDRLTSKARCFWFFQQIDINTRGLAKLTSAAWFLCVETGMPGTSDAPRVLNALMELLITHRRSLRAAMEKELAEEAFRKWQQAQQDRGAF